MRTNEGMSRLRFVGLLVTAGALATGGALAGACSSTSDAADGADASGPSTELPAATSADIQALGKWCLDEQARLTEAWAQDPSKEPPTFDHDIRSPELSAAVTAYAAGATDIPLSPSKCTRLFVTREGGRVVAETLVRGPFQPTLDPATSELVYRPAALARWTYGAAETLATGDYDGDGFAEARLRVVPEKEAVREERAPNDVVITRTTAKVAPEGGVVEVTREELEDGQLRPKRVVRASLLQRACNPPQKKPPPPTPPSGVWQGPTRACTGAERDQISKLVSTALQKGTGCLFAAGMRAESDQVLLTYLRNEARFDCSDDPKIDFWAANESGYMNFFPGKIRLIFNTRMFGESQAFQEGTVGHELFHFFDVHDGDLEAAADESQLRMSDPVYACEALCFSSKPTTCHLAACQQKKLSTRWKNQSCDGTLKQDDVYKVERARGDGVTISSCSSGQQVGSLCRSKTNGTEVQFCTTDAECAAACAGGTCESKSLSCLPDCR